MKPLPDHKDWVNEQQQKSVRKSDSDAKNKAEHKNIPLEYIRSKVMQVLETCGDNTANNYTGDNIRHMLNLFALSCCRRPFLSFTFFIVLSFAFFINPFYLII